MRKDSLHISFDFCLLPSYYYSRNSNRTTIGTQLNMVFVWRIHGLFLAYRNFWCVLGRVHLLQLLTVVLLVLEHAVHVGVVLNFENQVYNSINNLKVNWKEQLLGFLRHSDIWCVLFWKLFLFHPKTLSFLSNLLIGKELPVPHMRKPKLKKQ